MQTANQINTLQTGEVWSTVGPERIGPASDIHCCSWCNRYYLPNGEFVPAPFIAANVSHGVCPECFPKRLAAANAARLAMRR